MRHFAPLACIILILGLVCGVGQSLMIYQSDTELIQASDEIVYGKIVSVDSQWNAQKTHIETTAQILVADSFKKSDPGISPGSTIPVTVLGGTVGEMTEWVEDMPVFVPDTHALVYLSKKSNGNYAIYGLNQGFHPVNNNKSGKTQTTSLSSTASEGATIREKIITNLPGTSPDTTPFEKIETASDLLHPPDDIHTITITTVSPSIASAGTDSVITITGTGFGTKANRESNADVGFLYRLKPDGSIIEIYASGYPYFSSNANDIISWKDTEIKVKVPTGYTPDGYSGSASSGFLHVYTDSQTDNAAEPFAVTFGYGKKKWQAPVNYYINPGTMAGATSAIQNAGNTWNDQLSGSFFRFNNAGTTSSSVFGMNGQSLISFGPASDFASYPNVIAWASTWSTSGYIVEADVEFNSGFSWTTGTATGSQMNVETIVLHEMGHWLFLKDLYGWLPEYNSANTAYPSDINPEKKVMFGYNGDSIGNKNLKTLSPADIAGIRWIYPALNPVTAFTANKTYGTAPLAVAFMDASSGTPASWNWSFGDGILSSAQNPVHVYSAAGTYTVSLNASNSYGADVITKSNFINVTPPGPVAWFTATPPSGTVPLTVRFNDTSMNSPIAWNWSFGDGTNSTLRHPVHLYENTGNYPVTLTVSNDFGTNTTMKENFIAIYPKGDFNYNMKVDIGDVTLVAYMVVDRAPLRIPDADFNGNGFVDVGDAAKIAYYLAGKITGL